MAELNINTVERGVIVRIQTVARRVCVCLSVCVFKACGVFIARSYQPSGEAGRRYLTVER